MHDFAIIGAMGIAAFSIFVLIAALFFGFWIWALVDILKNEYTGSNKVIWLLLVLAVPLVGVILYFFIGRGQKIKLD